MNMMADRKPLTSEEISALVNRIADEFASDDREEVELVAKLPPGKRWLAPIKKPKKFAPIFVTNSEKIFPNFQCLKST